MKRLNISKNEISKEIFSTLGIPTVFASSILDLILRTITEGLKKNNTVKISGFGTFKLRKKKSRTGRNPMTGKKYQIKSRNVVTFHPSQIVKKIINNENNKIYKTIGEVAKEINTNTHTRSGKGI